MGKFLIIRFSSIGDIVLTTPLIRSLKTQIGDAEVHFVTKFIFRELLEGNPYIDKVHYLDDHFSKLAEELRKEKFDYVIDLHHNLRSMLIKRIVKAPAFSFNKLNVKKWLLVHCNINRLPDVHIVDRYFETVSGFHVVADGGGLDYFIPESQAYDISALPPVYREGYAAFIISGTYPTKRLPAGKVVELCQSIGIPIVLIGGKWEVPMSVEIERLAGSHVLNLVGKTSVNQSADLIRKARVVLTNDTGMMHIAAAFGKKILSFWGNTIPEFGMVPYMPHPSSEIMEVKGLKCRPCSKLGFSKCPRNHFHCMEFQDMKKAAAWVKAHF